MEELHLAICDDDSDILSVIAGSIRSEFKKNNIIATIELFSSTASLERRMKTRAFDLIFLDIDMPGEDGISFAHRVRENSGTGDIIFISNREDKVFDALRTDPDGFIRKSCFLTDVSDVIRHYIKKHNSEDLKKLVVTEGGETYTLIIDHIIYLEGRGKIQDLYSADRPGPLSLHRTMQDMEDTLRPDGFLRIHKGYLVNYRYIKHFTAQEAELTTGENLPLSRRRIQEIRDEYLKLMQKNNLLIL